MGRTKSVTKIQNAINEHNLNPDFFVLGPTLPDISSTRARDGLKRGDLSTLQQLLHPDVIHWLRMHPRSPYARYYPNTLADSSEAAVGTRVVALRGSDHYGSAGVVTQLGSSSADLMVQWDGGKVAPSKRRTLQRVHLVGVTGCSRSGKSWLSRLLAKEFPGAVFIGGDSFWRRTVEVTLPDGRFVTSTHQVAHIVSPMREHSHSLACVPRNVLPCVVVLQHMSEPRGARLHRPRRVAASDRPWSSKGSACDRGGLLPAARRTGSRPLQGLPAGTLVASRTARPAHCGLHSVGS